MEYDPAIRDFTKLQAEHPDDPFTSNYLLAGRSNHSATISSAKKNNLLIQFVCSENFFKIRNRFLEKIVER